MEAIEAPAPSSICSKAGPAARKVWPSTVSGDVMPFWLEAKPPASQVSASATLSAIICTISSRTSPWPPGN